MARFAQFAQGLGGADPRAAALREALMSFGQTLGAGAGTHGFAAAAPAVSAGLDTFGRTHAAETERARQEAERAERERLAAEDRARREVEEGREDVRWEHYQERYEAAKTEEEKARVEEEAQVEAERERWGQALEMVKDQNMRRRLTLMPPGEKRWSAWMEATGEPEPPKPPTMREFPDGSLREWRPSDPGADKNGWVVLQHKPAEEAKPKAGETMTLAQRRQEAQEIANREVGTWEQFRQQAIGNARARRPGELEFKDTSDITVSPRVREMYNQRWQAAFDRALGGLGAAAGTARPAAGAGAAAAPPAGGERPSPAALAGEMGLPPEAAPLIQAVSESVPPEVVQSPRFQQMLADQLAAGKTPEQIAREIRDAAARGAFGGRR